MSCLVVGAKKAVHYKPVSVERSSTVYSEQSFKRAVSISLAKRTQLFVCHCDTSGEFWSYMCV